MSRDQIKINKMFDEFHKNNPRVYDEIVRFAREAKEFAGKKSVSIRLLAERAKWEIIMTTNGLEEFPINLKFYPNYVNLIRKEHSDLKDMFTLSDRR